jgi:hypothetical protein
MGRRKQSDINRAVNFTKGDDDTGDRPTKKPKIQVASGKENQPLTNKTKRHRQLIDRHLEYRDMSASPAKNLLAEMKSRFRLELGDHNHHTLPVAGGQISTNHSDIIASGHAGSFYEFRISTRDSNDLGKKNILSLDSETMKKIANLKLSVFRT